MSPDSTRGGGTLPDEDPELGTPVRELERLIEPPSSGFLNILRNKIGRRSLTAQIVGLTWLAPKVVIVEMLRVVFDFFEPVNDKEGDPK